MNSPAKVDAFRKEIQALAALAMADRAFGMGLSHCHVDQGVQLVEGWHT